MTSPWAFDIHGPDFGTLNGPVPLASRGMGLPAKPGMYVITCGDCMPHVGTSRGLAGRVGSLARLGTHRGSTEVFCAAYCTGEAPLVWWEQLADAATAGVRERAFKDHYGEPPYPRTSYSSCVNGATLLKRIIEVAGADSWEAGYAEAVFTIGEKLSLLLQSRFAAVWRQIGVPPGPWESLSPK